MKQMRGLYDILGGYIGMRRLIRYEAVMYYSGGYPGQELKRLYMAGPSWVRQ